MTETWEANDHHMEIKDDQLRPLSFSERNHIFRQLYLAAHFGKWEMAKEFYDELEISYNTIITRRGETVLHIAVIADKISFVEQVVEMMSVRDLEIQDNRGNTAFFLAATAGNVKLADVMMRRNQTLAMMRDANNELPLYMAASRGHGKMVKFLYKSTKSYLNDNDKKNIFVALIYSDVYDVAMDMLLEDKTLAIGRDKNNETALHALAQKHSLMPDISPSNSLVQTFFYIIKNKLHVNFQLKSRKRKEALQLVWSIWDEVVQLEDSKISRLIETPWQLIFIAAKEGNVELLAILIHSYPDLIFKVDEHNYTIFHIAVLHRQENIFRLIHDLGSVKDVITAYVDDKGNNMLHLASELPSTDRLQVVSGAALQLQRELLWFEEVKKVVPLMPRDRAKNKKDQIPEDLFIISHKDLMKEGEGWMRGTADKCMLVATLIATVVFAAAFTVPGGNQQDRGIPIFLRKIVFKLFFMADAVSLISSVASIMTFLAIMTSRYQLSDFKLSLPGKLIIGLVMLFVSIVAMLVAFIAATFLVFNHGNGLIWFSIPIAVIGVMPILIFVWMQRRLFTDMFEQACMSMLNIYQNELSRPIVARQVAEILFS